MEAIDWHDLNDPRPQDGQFCWIYVSDIMIVGPLPYYDLHDACIDSEGSGSIYTFNGRQVTHWTEEMNIEQPIEE